MNKIITVCYEDFKYKITDEKTGEKIECTTYLTAGEIIKYLLLKFETTDWAMAKNECKVNVP